MHYWSIPIRHRAAVLPRRPTVSAETVQDRRGKSGPTHKEDADVRQRRWPRPANASAAPNAERWRPDRCPNGGAAFRLHPSGASDRTSRTTRLPDRRRTWPTNPEAQVGRTSMPLPDRTVRFARPSAGPDGRTSNKHRKSVEPFRAPNPRSHRCDRAGAEHPRSVRLARKRLCRRRAEAQRSFVPAKVHRRGEPRAIRLLDRCGQPARPSRPPTGPTGPTMRRSAKAKTGAAPTPPACLGRSQLLQFDLN
jgi:hypothetical protein